MSPPKPAADEESRQIVSEIEKRDLALDLTQFLLDVIGVFEPTPFADTGSALISLSRKDWGGAFFSAVSLLPYLGDLAKLGKIQKYSNSIVRAVSVAEKDAAFAEKIRPVLQRLKALLDDVPTAELPEALKDVSARIAGFLKQGPKLNGPVRSALASLPAERKAGFLAAMKQPALKNPRRLRKRPGPVDEDSLLNELASKGFEPIKTGKHSARGVGEDSDIFLRRILGEDGKHYFETVRIDRRIQTPLPKGARSNPSKITDAGTVQRRDKPFRRVHNLLGSTSKHASATNGGGQVLDAAGHRALVNELQAGGRKGDFSHWHHERIPATPDALAKYLKKPARGELPAEGTAKFDNMGQIVHKW